MSSHQLSCYDHRGIIDYHSNGINCQKHSNVLPQVLITKHRFMSIDCYCLGKSDEILTEGIITSLNFE